MGPKFEYKFARVKSNKGENALLCVDKDNDILFFNPLFGRGSSPQHLTHPDSSSPITQMASQYICEYENSFVFQWNTSVGFAQVQDRNSPPA